MRDVKDLCVKVALFLLFVSGFALIGWSRQPDSSIRHLQFCEIQTGQMRLCEEGRPAIEIEIIMMPDGTLRGRVIPVGSKP